MRNILAWLRSLFKRERTVAEIDAEMQKNCGPESNFGFLFFRPNPNRILARYLRLNAERQEAAEREAKQPSDDAHIDPWPRHDWN